MSFQYMLWGGAADNNSRSEPTSVLGFQSDDGFAPQSFSFSIFLPVQFYRFVDASGVFIYRQ